MVPFSASHVSLRRPLTSYSKVQALLSGLLRNRTFQLKRVRERNPKYLDVGCGGNMHPGFINIDFSWRPGLDLCWDITRGLPFEDASVRGVFSEHCLEHFSLPVAEELLKEFRRVLSPGGHVRIVVPDGELYLRTYWEQVNGGAAASRFPFEDAEPADRLRSPILNVNRVFYQDRDSPHGHRFIYDKHLLCALLLRAGFDWARETDYRMGRDPVLLIDTEVRRIESLYVEAGIEPAAQ